MSAQSDHDLKMVREAAERLGEHFDSVQILTTRHEPGTEDGTVNVNYGVGNWFTRYGQVREWLIKCEERTKAFVRREEEQE